MRSYRRHHADSGVVAYAFGADAIAVQFNSGDAYLYTMRSVGEPHFKALKQYAQRGRGLSRYISQNPEVRHGYTLKLNLAPRPTL